MRLSLDLSKFYTDHRKLAYIFVNEKTMPLIEDVEKRIAGIFNISDFYLMQHDHYLPPLEEISILIDDCDVRVIPFDQVSIATDTCIPKKKKKKKKTMEELFEVEPQDDIFKKTRKRKFTEENHINDESEQKSDKTHEDVVEKKSKIENELSKNNSNVSYFSYTKPRETFKEHLHKILIKEDEIIKRPPNIVKTIIVTSTNSKTTDNKTVTKDSDTDSSSNSSSTEQNEIVKEPKRRRRRRTRIRKKKTTNNEETMPQQLNDTDNTPKLYLPKPTGCHIRFSDDGSKPNEKLSEKQPEVVENGNIVKDPVQDNTIKDDFILKQPLLVDISPKINDIIAFKMLRLNEKYLPELSPFIIGKVIAFNSDDKQITFDIKQGLDYCLPPQGKFFMEIDEDEGKTTEHSFKWTDLVEPRLIYP